MGTGTLEEVYGGRQVQLVNAIAPVVATQETAVVQPVSHPVLPHARAALDLAVDVHVEGETVRPDFPPDGSRWPCRVADLGPSTLVDAAASVSANKPRVAVTLVNRGLSAEPAACRRHRRADLAAAVFHGRRGADCRLVRYRRGPR